MKKLELKHLAPYLPFDLKLVGCQSALSARNLDKWQNDEWELTPMFRPMERLSKWVNHSGNRFIPLNVMAASMFPQYDDFEIIEETDLCTMFNQNWLIIGWRNNMLVMWENRENSFVRPAPMNVYTWQCLFRWHFDVFGLIDKGLAEPLI